METSPVRVVRIDAKPSGWRRTWARLNREAGRSLPIRVASAGLNLAFGCTADESAWISEAARRGREEIERAAVPVGHVFSRLNPVASHLAAESIVRDHEGLAWTAYFSDPWPFFLYPPPYQSRSGRLYRWRALSVVRRICARADSILFPSRRLADALGPTYEIREERVFIAPHMGPARESAEGQGATGRRGASGEALVIRHAGFLMKERRVDGLFSALLDLAEADRRDLRVEFMGRRAKGIEIPPELDDVVTFLTPRPPDEARAWMAEADVALLVEADCAEGIFLPSKFAEYVVDGYPLLCLSPERGTIADYLEDGDGARVSPTDVRGIAEALRVLLAAKRSGRLGEFAPSPALQRTFRPEVVGGQVEQALAAALQRRPR